MAKEKKEDFKSDWAYSVKHQKNIHISEAESGLKGYRCLGCQAKMQAVIQKKDPSRLSFFRHHASDVDNEKIECVRASKVYREQIARAILNRLKYVSAPAIYKYPPLDSDIDLFPMKIEGRKKIEAAYTRAELTFYEDENGVIKWGKNPEINEKDLLIRPDVTFFNKENKPILFIEFIVHNKINQEKFLKLARIGINTLRINIPRKSEAEIEKALKSSKTYKWVYNEKEANTEYIPVSRTNSKELSQINDNERIFFEEDFRCRQAEINQLIRSIKRSLQSKQYRAIELGLNQQIQKVESNTERAEQRLADMEESNRREAFARNSIEEDDEDRKYKDLEGRYFRKRSELTDAINKQSINQKSRADLIKNIRAEEEEIRAIEQEEVNVAVEIRERIQNEFVELRGRIQKRIDRELASTNSAIASLGLLYNDIPREVSERFRFKEEIISSRIKSTREKNQNLEKTIFREFEDKIKFEESEIRRIGREETEFLEFAEKQRERIESEKVRIKEEERYIEESARREFDEEIEKNARKLPEEFTDLLEAQRMGNNFENLKCEEDSYRRAQAFIRKGTWLQG